MIPFKGRPPPTVTWRKGEKNLGIDERYNIQNTESSTLLTIPQVTRNDTGKYVLTIENGVGEPKSSFVNVKVLDTPSACQKLQLKHVSRGTVTLIWEPPLINGGSEITNYVIEKRDATKRAWSTVTTKCSHTTFKVTNLSEKTAFFFRVLAENEHGLGEPCETSEPVKPAEVPGPVKDLAMKDSTKTSVTLQWSKPDFDGGSIISDYVIEKKMIEEKEWSHAGISKTCEFEVEKLKELSVMEFRVSAKNEKGLSDAVTVGPITVKDFVITPEADLSDISGGQITVRIGHNMHIELPYKGKPRPTMSCLQYNIDPYILKNMNFLVRRVSLYMPLLLVFLLGMNTFINMTEYIYFILSFFLVPPTIEFGAEHFEGLTVKAGESIRLKVLIKGRPVPQVTWFKDGKEIEKKMNIEITNVIGSSTIFVRDATRDHRGIYTVEAKNASGTKEEDITVRVQAVPDAPGIPEPTHITGDSITLTWTRPKSDGGNEINQYILERREKKSVRWVKVSSKRAIAETRYRVTGLTEGNEYEFQVMAENAAGVGPPSAVSRLIKCREPVNPPSAPTVVKVTDTSKTSVSLEWTKPVFDGGMEIIGYIIEMCKADLGEWHKVNAETCIATKYTVTDLEAGEHYKFRVSAVNGAGKGESCEVPATIQATDRLSSPEIDIDANFKQTHIVRAGATIRLFIAFLGKPVPTATWSKADSDLSLRADIHITDSFSTLTVENCNRNDAGKYVFTVENVSGSKSITFTVKEPAPPKRLDIIDTTKSSAVLAWLKPDHDGGSRVTGYLLEMKQKGSDYWAEAGQTKQLTFTVEGLVENNEYEFRVKAKNDAGYSEPREAFSSVIIKEPQIEPTADLSGITRQLITCKAGSTFTIDIPISGRPAPKVTWKLEEMRLKETDRVTIKTTKDRTTLIVKDSMRGDSGKYYLTLENTAGVKTFAVTSDIIECKSRISKSTFSPVLYI
uniref:Titin n=1 Tax=Chelonoidis abingdonii TaxID=106734 RepID=A0A8C0QLT9_CHEAB